MKPAVTARMEQNAVGHGVAATINAPDDLVAAPSGHPRDRISAFRTESPLTDPETKELFLAFRISYHLHVKPTLKVGFPLRVVGVGGPFNLDMSDDVEGRGEEEPGDSNLSVFVAAPLAEGPSAIQVLKIPKVDPPGRLVRVPSASPAPQTVVDGLVNA